MRIGKYEIVWHEARYRGCEWYNYIIPSRLTLQCNPPVYKWLWWAIGVRE